MAFHGARLLRGLPPAAAAAALVVLLLASSAHAQRRSCLMSTARTAAVAPAAPLRFGIYPGGPAGSVDPKASPRPEDPARRLAALQGLRGGGPFVVRLYSGWTGDPRAGHGRGRAE